MTPTRADAAVTGVFVPAARPGVRAIGVGTEAIVVDEAVDGLHLLNAQATLVWACFDGRSTLAAIATDLADVLDVPFERVLLDVVAVTADLVDQGLVADGRAAPPAEPVAVAPPSMRVDGAGTPRALEEPPNP